MTYKQPLQKKKSNIIMLPIYKIKGKFYFRDKRLREYRNVKNPFDVIKEENVSLNDLQKPTKADSKKLYEIPKKLIKKWHIQ